MSSLSRYVCALTVMVLCGIGVGAGQPQRSSLDGTAAPVSAGRAAPRSSGVSLLSTPAVAVNGALLNEYCISCHSQRLKTGGLILEGIDGTPVADHAELFEKVVRKLKTGQMPPAGRPRPDKARTTAFVETLETEIDRAAAASPNPGRLAVHRLNRLEYVNIIRDLLALEIDPALLPADNGGVGFDNNADVLSVTPALMNRYMSAATKVSRLALGDPTIKPSIRVYRASDWATQTERASEEQPFGTHGGIVVRHAFPLD